MVLVQRIELPEWRVEAMKSDAPGRYPLPFIIEIFERSSSVHGLLISRRSFTIRGPIHFRFNNIKN